MAGTKDFEDIYQLYQEGKMSNAVAGAAMGAASLIGNPNTSMGDTTYNSSYNSETQQVINIDEFVSLWAKYYQTEDDSDKKENAYALLSDGIEIPANAKNAIDVAVYIFGGDMGVTPNVLEDLLIYTGEVESAYKTRKQYDGGPARGYWQVEPSTAIDNLRNGKALLGEKFKKRFKEELNYIGYTDDDHGYNLKLVSDVLERSDEFAAAMSAMWWIRNAHNEL